MTTRPTACPCVFAWWMNRSAKARRKRPEPNWRTVSGRGVMAVEVWRRAMRFVAGVTASAVPPERIPCPLYFARGALVDLPDRPRLRRKDRRRPAGHVGDHRVRVDA